MLSVLGGDFNWVTANSDRISISTASPSMRNDNGEDNHFKNHISIPHDLHEMFQSEPTHASASTRSRLDRIYCNQHVSEQLDRHLKVAALEWKVEVSNHRAVLFSRMLPQKVAHNERKVSDSAVKHEDFPRLVALNFNARLKDSPEASNIQKLMIIKNSIKEVSERLDKDACSIVTAESLEDRLGVTMKFIRSSEAGFLGAISACIVRYPSLKGLVDNPYDVEGNLSIKLRKVRAHAIELAREHALDELNQAHADLVNGDATRAQYRKQKYTRLLFKIAPGRAGAVNAVRNPRGEIRTDSESIAKLLKTHWSNIFLAQGIDSVRLKLWLEEDQDDRPFAEFLPFPADKFKLTKKHIRRAIDHSNNSAPGPDGIPFAAWRKLGPLAVSTLFDAFQDMTAEGGPERMAEQYPDFNASLLLFLPKKASGTLEDGTVFYDADSVRPLNVTNADNRLLASAVRLLIEPFVASRISPSQRGFIAGRSMLANLIDIDESMAFNATTEESAAALLFDFSAAFPSVEHELLHAHFAALGWPDWLLRFVVVLYQLNHCFIAMDGARFDGFKITRGIRQGCPLSPLLFAVASDLLLRRLQRLLPRACIKAYADDLAIVIPEGMECLGGLEAIFMDYELISGLALSIPKTVYLPLHPYTVDTLRQQIHDAAPSWGGVAIKSAAKYLGFMIGPDRKDSSWDAPIAKYLARAKIWGKINPGLFNNIMAYRVFIAPVLSFIGQLDILPEAFVAAESKACESLFPGGRGWMTVGCLRHLKTLGFPNELPDIHINVLAAKVRVHRFEDARHGGLKIEHRAKQMRAVINNPDNMFRRSRFPIWLQNLYIFSLQSAVVDFKARELSATSGPSLLGNDGSPEQARVGWQARAIKLISPPTQGPALLHLRRRLDRWNIPTLPGHRCGRALRALETLRSHAPPRVIAAVIRCLCNGWITGRRFQKGGRCVLGCSPGEDSIEHYAYCPHFHNLCSKHLHIGKPPYQRCLEDFLCINPCTDIIPAHVSDGYNSAVTLRAISLYSLYNTLGSVRHGEVSRRDAHDVFGRHLQESSRGHAGATALLFRCRVRPRT